MSSELNISTGVAIPNITATSHFELSDVLHLLVIAHVNKRSIYFKVVRYQGILPLPTLCEGLTGRFCGSLSSFSLPELMPNEIFAVLRERSGYHRDARKA
jgi:hypothetical protein